MPPPPSVSASFTPGKCQAGMPSGRPYRYCLKFPDSRKAVSRMMVPQVPALCRQCDGFCPEAIQKRQTRREFLDRHGAFRRPPRDDDGALERPDFWRMILYQPPQVPALLPSLRGAFAPKQSRSRICVSWIATARSAPRNDGQTACVIATASKARPEAIQVQVSDIAMDCHARQGGLATGGMPEGPGILAASVISPRPASSFQ